MTAGQQEAISRAVAYGHNSAVAMNEGKETLSNHYAMCFHNQVKVWQAAHGMTFGQWDMCYQIGYNAARKD